MSRPFDVLKNVVIIFCIDSLRVQKTVGFPVEETQFDSVVKVNLNPQQRIEYSVGNYVDSWPFSFWQHRSTENAAELREFKSTLRDHNIIHLIARPLAVYYHDDTEILNTTKSLNSKICRATVPAADTFHTLDTDESTLNILFVCSSGTCCGLDCCHLNVTFIFVLSCICLTLCSSVTYVGLRSLSTSKKLRHIIPLPKLCRQRRVIKRANAQRKTRFESNYELRNYSRDSDSFEESPPTRKKSQSMKIPPKNNTPEILLVPPKEPKLVYCNSMPSKHRPKKDIIL
ncbi:hypothetical protein FO519_002836 [Halicephalobus sp. NKZ332]|nr:hypothetical protein FO519_002836 [Halicephalobus sp. NKZ332]